MKRLSVYIGTDIAFTTPSHPISIATSTVRFMKRLSESNDDNYEVNTNSAIAINIIDFFSKRYEISTQYFINGKRSSLKSVLADLNRGEEYMKNILKE